MAAVTLSEQVACVKREIAMRERVYARQVQIKKMKAEVAERELAAMRAVLATLETLAAEPTLAFIAKVYAALNAAIAEAAIAEAAIAEAAIAEAAIAKAEAR